jgi:flavin reductase (DIM6/NTAB) family NADH-FMN oxidoreductase RutF
MFKLYAMLTGLEQIIDMDQRYRATFINSLPGFKNLQMVGTIDRDGISNIGLFNSIFHLGANPPLLGMVFRPESYERDTLKNIMNNGQYTLNNVLPQWYENAHQTSAHYSPDESEFRSCQFTPVYIDKFKSPFVQ